VIPSSAEVTTPTKFIVIEDDPDHQKIAEMVLNSAGVHDITFFGTGEEAISHFQGTVPAGSTAGQVILIDLMLPNIGGLEILQHLRKDTRWQAATLVVLSCSTSADDRRRSREYGADAFLSKPLRQENVREILSSVSSQ
jgi:CheY-like chemotaxis protein